MVTVKIVSTSKHSMNGEPLLKDSPWLSSGASPPVSQDEVSGTHSVQTKTAPSSHRLIPYTLLMLLVAVLTRLVWLIL
jgi:hypothetical protein